MAFYEAPVTIHNVVNGTATQNSVDIPNSGWKGVLLVFDITEFPAAGNLTLKVQMKDTVSGKYIDFANDAARSSNATFVMVVDPNEPAASDGINTVKPRLLPPLFRIQVAHSNGANADYTVSAYFIQDISKTKTSI